MTRGRLVIRTVLYLVIALVILACRAASGRIAASSRRVPARRAHGGVNWIFFFSY